MFLKNLEDCEEIIANDGCHLREFLHPKNDPIDLPYSLAVARVNSGKSTFKHYLEQNEVYFIISGTVCFHINDETKGVNKAI